MRPIDVINAFSEREVIDRELRTCEFEDVACSLATLRESDQLKLLPILMAYVLRNHQNGAATNYGEMVVFRLMPQPDGWANLTESMSQQEVQATREWLIFCKNLPFAENCKDELLLTIKFFESQL